MPDVKRYYVIGLMSGSSLDGLDIAYTEIETGAENKFRILHAQTIAYDTSIKKFLQQIDITKQNFQFEENYFAEITAHAVNQFISDFHIEKIDFIASHGHTIYHYPAEKRTLQIGDGKRISEITQHTVISNFRQADLDAGGQGAPLVPVCDALFFNGYDACLNIGGIANISFEKNNLRIGFDICGANQLLNACAAELNLPFDHAGEIAATGNVNEELLSRLNNNFFFKKQFPKSLDNHFVEMHFTKLLSESEIATADKLATANKHIATQIANCIRQQTTSEQIQPSDYRLLVTGGGAYNTFLIQTIEKSAGIQIHLPAKEIIEYKEALAICLMGVLRMENKPNFITSVTGAAYAVSGGDIYFYGK